LADTDKGKAASELSINYIKSPQYREMTCDGALGGITSKNKIWMALYAERHPLPRVLTYKAVATDEPNAVRIDETGPPLRVESKEGVIRHVEFSTYMTLEVAQALHKWLGERIAQLTPNSSK